ncbi:hypothetical protein [Spongiactinospora sp. 9N601]|uniref:hypothetical protein n=1 Tax=Spongiactinospora sp. 9N601 TaxID=3375149 RepID=UPI0037915A96
MAERFVAPPPSHPTLVDVQEKLGNLTAVWVLEGHGCLDFLVCGLPFIDVVVRVIEQASSFSNRGWTYVGFKPWKIAIIDDKVSDEFVTYLAVLGRIQPVLATLHRRRCWCTGVGKK